MKGGLGMPTFCGLEKAEKETQLQIRSIFLGKEVCHGDAWAMDANHGSGQRTTVLRKGGATKSFRTCRPNAVYASYSFVVACLLVFKNL
jgi:hypothetical protein